MNHQHYHFAHGETILEVDVVELDGDRTIVCARVCTPTRARCAAAVVEKVKPSLYRRCLEDAIIEAVCEAAVRADVALDTVQDALYAWLDLHEDTCEYIEREYWYAWFDHKWQPAR